MLDINITGIQKHNQYVDMIFEEVSKHYIGLIKTNYILECIKKDFHSNILNFVIHSLEERLYIFNDSLYICPNNPLLEKLKYDFNGYGNFRNYYNEQISYIFTDKLLEEDLFYLKLKYPNSMLGEESDVM